MQLKKKLSLILACVVSICCLNIGAVAVETQWDNNFIEITQGTMRATKTFEVTVSAHGNFREKYYKHNTLGQFYRRVVVDYYKDADYTEYGCSESYYQWWG